LKAYNTPSIAFLNRNPGILLKAYPQYSKEYVMDVFTKYSPLDKGAGYDRTSLKKALEGSSDGIAALLTRGWDDGGKVKGFKKGGVS